MAHYTDNPNHHLTYDPGEINYTTHQEQLACRKVAEMVALQAGDATLCAEYLEALGIWPDKQYQLKLRTRKQ